jgi:hypothetical protein
MEVAANMNRSSLAQPGDGSGTSVGGRPAACYTVNISQLTDPVTIAADGGGGAEGCPALRPVVGVKHTAWCTPARDESGTILSDAAAWGFCAAGPRLPGAGFDYDAAALDALAVLQPLIALGRLDGACWSVLANFSGNRAGR